MCLAVMIWQSKCSQRYPTGCQSYETKINVKLQKWLFFNKLEGLVIKNTDINAQVAYCRKIAEKNIMKGL